MTDYMWQDFVTYVGKLQNMIMKVHRHEEISPKNSFSKSEYQKCNELVFEMVFENQDDNFMGKKLQEEFAAFIQLNLTPVLRNVRTQQDILLEEFKKAWNSFSLFKKWISRLFHHYNKNTEIHCQKQLHSDNLSVEEFKKRILFEFKGDIIEGVAMKLTLLRQSKFRHLTEQVQITGKQSRTQTRMQRDISENLTADDPNGMMIEKSDNMYDGFQLQDNETVQLLKDCLKVFTEVLPPKSNERTLIYGKLNEKLLEKSLQTFEQHQDYIGNFECEDYVKFAKLMKQDEQDLIGRIFEGNESLAFINTNISDLYYEVMLRNYAQTLVIQKYGFAWLLENEKLEVKFFGVIFNLWSQTLRSIYELYIEKNSELEALLGEFGRNTEQKIQVEIEEYVKMIDNAADEKAKRQIQTVSSLNNCQGPYLIEKIIKLSSTARHLINEAFSSHHTFRSKLAKSLSTSLSQQSSVQTMLSKFSIPFLLSNFILEKLEKFEALEEEKTLEPLLNECVEILACLDDKDKFLFWFEKGISKKLLNSTKGNGTFWEEWFVKTVKSKVKLYSCYLCLTRQLGWEFTKNLETIVREVKKFAEDKVNWEKYLDNLRMPSEMRNELSDLDVVVVPKCDWLLPIKLELQPSVDIESLQRTYENYFVGKSQNSNKSLEWNYFYGTVEFRYLSGGSRYVIQCRPYQYFLLRLFESGQNLNFDEIKKQLLINNDQYLYNMIQSLISINLKKSILKPNSPLTGDQIKNLEGEIKSNPQIKFCLNPEFKSKSKKVLLKDAKFSEKKEEDGAVEDERKHSVQSVIVRVMKSRKEMVYNELVNEVEKLMFKFRPTTRVRLLFSPAKFVARQTASRYPDPKGVHREISG